MDKLVEHAIRMLEIVEGENDFFRNDAKRQADSFGNREVARTKQNAGIGDVLCPKKSN